MYSRSHRYVARFKRSRLIDCLLLICWLPAAGASDNAYVWDPQYVTTDQGLPQSSVRSVLVDHDNYTWVGTELGLARYDGSRFVDFSAPNADLPSHVLIALFEDSHGRLWTVWYPAGIKVLMPDRSTVLTLSPAAGYPHDLADHSSCIEDRNGVVWFFGRSNLHRIRTSADGQLTSSKDEFGPGPPGFFSSPIARCVDIFLEAVAEKG